MQPIGVAGGMPAPAPIPTQQLQTQYTQLMAYIAQQQKALQTCTLVLQAGGLPGLCVSACLLGPAVMRTQVCKAGGSPRTLCWHVSQACSHAHVSLQNRWVPQYLVCLTALAAICRASTASTQSPSNQAVPMAEVPRTAVYTGKGVPSMQADLLPLCRLGD